MPNEVRDEEIPVPEEPDYADFELLLSPSSTSWCHDNFVNPEDIKREHCDERMGCYYFGCRNPSKILFLCDDCSRMWHPRCYEPPGYRAGFWRCDECHDESNGGHIIATASATSQQISAASLNSTSQQISAATDPLNSMAEPTTRIMSGSNNVNVINIGGHHQQVQLHLGGSDLQESRPNVLSEIKTPTRGVGEKSKRELSKKNNKDGKSKRGRKDQLSNNQQKLKTRYFLLLDEYERLDLDAKERALMQEVRNIGTLPSSYGPNTQGILRIFTKDRIMIHCIWDVHGNCTFFSKINITEIIDKLKESDNEQKKELAQHLHAYKQDNPLTFNSMADMTAACLSGQMFETISDENCELMTQFENLPSSGAKLSLDMSRIIIAMWKRSLKVDDTDLYTRYKVDANKIQSNRFGVLHTQMRSENEDWQFFGNGQSKLLLLNVLLSFFLSIFLTFFFFFFFLFLFSFFLFSFLFVSSLFSVYLF